MSFGVDVNILLYASDRGSPLQPSAARFLEKCVVEREVFCLAWITLMSYLRMATHPSIFAKPLTHDAAARNVESLLALPHVRVIGEEENFWSAYRLATRDVPTRGNLVPDAHLATILRQNGVGTLFTRDRDFRKFAFLDVRDPLQ
ncbi:MAG TPA: TA system VapC family ribonuclease toxin [Casimicrobiaceae bacterium]|nr:TA system VapC family ribonuclease toxin [Casimicrobiaceae bacterium]